MSSFAKSLKMLRNEHKLSQSELAEILQTTIKSISHWETGYSEPSIDQLIALADYFKISLDELVGRE